MKQKPEILPRLISQKPHPDHIVPGQEGNYDIMTLISAIKRKSTEVEDINLHISFHLKGKRVCMPLGHGVSNYTNA